MNTFFEHTFVEAAKWNLQDQIVFGTAYPFMPIVPTTRYYLEKWNLSDVVMEKVMGKNIMRALKLEE